MNEIDDSNLRSEDGNGCPNYSRHEKFCFSDEKDGCTGKEHCTNYFVHQLEQKVKALFSKENFLDGYEVHPEFYSHFIKREEDIIEN